MRKRFKVFLGDRVIDVEIEYSLTGVTSSSKSFIKPKSISNKFREFFKQRPSGISLKGRVISPISGRVILVKVKEGTAVKKGDVIAVLESMKTKVEIYSHKDGIIKKVLVKEGDFIKSGSAVAEIGE